MRDRVRIERQLFTQSSSGQTRPAWVTLTECWANIRALNQSQRVRADQTVAPVTHEIRIRWQYGIDHKCRIIATDYGIDAESTMVWMFDAATLLAHYSTSSEYGTGTYGGSPITDWFIGPQGSGGSETNRAFVALTTEGVWVTGVVTDPGDSEHEIDSIGDTEGTFTGTVAGGNLLPDSANFVSFTVPDTDAVYQVDGVIDPDGKRSDMVLQAYRVKK